MKSTIKRVTVGAALGGALFLSAGIAHAEPRDGQVDLALGTAGVLEDVPIGAAAQVAADVCNADVGQVTTFAQNVDASGATQNVCNNNVGAVELRQNDATDDDAEAQDNTPAETGTADETTTAPATTTTTAEEGS